MPLNYWLGRRLWSACVDLAAWIGFWLYRLGRLRILGLPAVSGESMRLVLTSLSIVPLAIGCGGGDEEKPAAGTDADASGSTGGDGAGTSLGGETAV